jgi:hypothetical protein
MSEPMRNRRNFRAVRIAFQTLPVLALVTGFIPPNSVRFLGKTRREASPPVRGTGTYQDLIRIYR